MRGVIATEKRDEDRRRNSARMVASSRSRADPDCRPARRGGTVARRRALPAARQSRRPHQEPRGGRRQRRREFTRRLSEPRAPRDGDRRARGRRRHCPDPGPVTRLRRLREHALHGPGELDRRHGHAADPAAHLRARAAGRSRSVRSVQPASEFSNSLRRTRAHRRPARDVHASPGKLRRRIRRPAGHTGPAVGGLHLLLAHGRELRHDHGERARHDRHRGHPPPRHALPAAARRQSGDHPDQRDGIAGPLW